MDDLLLKIHENYHRMTRSQKKIADYVLQNPALAEGLSAAGIASQCGVSESSVIRFASFLDFESFPAFLQALSYAGRHYEEERTDPERLPESDVLRSVLEADAKRIRDTLYCTDNASFEKAQEYLLNAEHIYILGIRSCEPLAELLGFYLNILRGDVTVLKTTSTSEVFEQMLRIGPKDAMVGISFPRYSMRTLKAMEFAHDRRAKVIAITDSNRSPMCMYSSCLLLAKSSMINVLDSLVAPLSLINALIVALCIKRPKEVRKNLKSLERVWGDYQVYLNDEINFINEDLIDRKTPVYHEESGSKG